MGLLNLAKDSIDLGIVVSDSDKALAFYRDTLGFEHVGDMPRPDGGVMHRLMCGTSLIKLLAGPNVASESLPGGINTIRGYRYWTISVTNLEEVVAGCERAGYKVPIGPREARPGLTIAMVEDPDGNWVEFIQAH